MPSPGSRSIAASIGAKSYTVEGGYDTQFIESNEFIQKLAKALDAGWTSASPIMPTSMSAAFSAEFAGYLAGRGQVFVNCIASGIDQETAVWVASWNPIVQVHTYVVNAGSIVGRIMGCSLVQSNGARAMAEVCADAFVDGFGQEVG